MAIRNIFGRKAQVCWRRLVRATRSSEIALCKRTVQQAKVPLQ